MRRVHTVIVGMVIMIILFGSLASADVAVVDFRAYYQVNAISEPTSAVISAVSSDNLTIFELSKNGTIMWVISSKNLVPVNASFLSSSLYYPMGFGSAVSRAPDGGVLIGFTARDENLKLSPALIKVSENGSFEWGYIYKIGSNITPHVDSIYARGRGILLSGHIENKTASGSKFVPFLMLLEPNGKVVWIKTYSPSLLKDALPGEAIEINGSYLYILQGKYSITYRTTPVILRLDKNGNVISVNYVSGMKTVNSMTFDGKYLYLLGVNENGTLLAKFDPVGDNLIWAKEYVIEFDYRKASCSLNETNMSLVSSKIIFYDFRKLLHVETDYVAFPMPFVIKLPLEGVPCNGGIFEQEAALKPITAIFKVNANGDILNHKIVTLNSTYLPESFGYSNGTFVVSLSKAADSFSSGIVEPKQIVLMGSFNDLLNLNGIMKETNLNVTVKGVSVHLGSFHLIVGSRNLNVSSVPVKPFNVIKKVPEDVEIKVYKTETRSTEKSTTTRKTTTEMCGPASLVAIAILPVLLFLKRE